MKDIVTPVPQEDVKGVIRKCLEQAAQINYQRITEYARVEGDYQCLYVSHYYVFNLFILQLNLCSRKSS